LEGIIIPLRSFANMPVSGNTLKKQKSESPRGLRILLPARDRFEKSRPDGAFTNAPQYKACGQNRLSQSSGFFPAG
jgi:hypothetical protein